MKTRKLSKREAAFFFLKCLKESPAFSSIAKVILFGSVAKGSAHKDSDIDLIVIATKDVEKIRDECAEAQLKTWLEFREPIEPLVYPLDSLREGDNYFLLHVKEGEEIYSMNPEQIRREEARNFLEIAGEFLEGSRAVLREGCFRVSLDAAYNAAELCAKGLILLQGGEILGSHGGVVGEFGRLLVLTHKAPKELGRKFSRSLELRGRARYEKKRRNR